MTPTAQAIWKQITDEMMMAKKSGMNPRELAIYTDKHAVLIIAAALQTTEQRVWEEAAQVAEHEGLAAHLPSDKWDQGYRRAASNIANACRADASRQGEEGTR